MEYEHDWVESGTIPPPLQCFEQFNPQKAHFTSSEVNENFNSPFQTDFSPTFDNSEYANYNFVPNLDVNPLEFYDEKFSNNLKPASIHSPNFNNPPIHSPSRSPRKMVSHPNLAAIEGLGIAEPIESLNRSNWVNSPERKPLPGPRVSKKPSKKSLGLKPKRSRANLKEVELSPALSELDSKTILAKNVDARAQPQAHAHIQTTSPALQTNDIKTELTEPILPTGGTQISDSGVPQISHIPHIPRIPIAQEVSSSQKASSQASSPQVTSIQAASPHVPHVPQESQPASHMSSMPLDAPLSRSPGLHAMKSMPQMRGRPLINPPTTPFQQRPRGKANAASQHSPSKVKTPASGLNNPDTPSTALMSVKEAPDWSVMGGGQSPTPAARFNSKTELISEANDQSPAKGMWQHNFPPPVADPNPRKSASTSNLRRVRRKPKAIPEMSAAMGEFKVELKPKKKRSMVPKQLRNALKRDKAKKNQFGGMPMGPHMGQPMGHVMGHPMGPPMGPIMGQPMPMGPPMGNQMGVLMPQFVGQPINREWPVSAPLMRQNSMAMPAPPLITRHPDGVQYPATHHGVQRMPQGIPTNIPPPMPQMMQNIPSDPHTLNRVPVSAPPDLRMQRSLPELRPMVSGMHRTQPMHRQQMYEYELPPQGPPSQHLTDMYSPTVNMQPRGPPIQPHIIVPTDPHKKIQIPARGAPPPLGQPGPPPLPRSPAQEPADYEPGTAPEALPNHNLALSNFETLHEAPEDELELPECPGTEVADPESMEYNFQNDHITDQHTPHQTNEPEPTGISSKTGEESPKNIHENQETGSEAKPVGGAEDKSYTNLSLNMEPSESFNVELASRKLDFGDHEPTAEDWVNFEWTFDDSFVDA